MEVREYIKKEWVNYIRKPRKEGKYEMPFPFITTQKDYDLQFYWDIYFINKAITIDGYFEYALNHVNNFLHAVRFFGYCPNSLSLNGAKWNLQPPLLSLMVKDVYETSKDKNWLKESLDTLLIDYKYWMDNRYDEKSNLNFYDVLISKEKDFLSYFDYVSTRVELDKNVSKERKISIAKNYIAQAETGEDFTERLSKLDDTKILSIGLNSHLYGYEKNIAYFYKELGDIDNYNLFEKKAKNRENKINQYLFNGKIYRDFDIANNKEVEACSNSLLPYFYKFGKGNPIDVLDKIMFNDSIVLYKGELDNVYQWDYPNVWAPIQYFAFIALINYGYDDIASKIAKRFNEMVENEYNLSNRIYEKYSLLTSRKSENKEYQTWEMLGWTASVYILFKNYLDKKD